MWFLPLDWTVAVTLPKEKDRSCSFMDPAAREREVGRASSKRVLKIESEQGKVSLRFPPPAFNKQDSAETLENICPRPQIKRPRNGGTWARNANVHKSMTSEGSLSS